MKIEKLTREDFLNNYYNAELKAIVNAKVELESLKSSPVISIGEDIGKKASAITGLAKFIEEGEKKIKVVEDLLIKEKNNGIPKEIQ